MLMYSRHTGKHANTRTRARTHAHTCAWKFAFSMLSKRTRCVAFSALGCALAINKMTPEPPEMRKKPVHDKWVKVPTEVRNCHILLFLVISVNYLGNNDTFTFAPLCIATNICLHCRFVIGHGIMSQCNTFVTPVTCHDIRFALPPNVTKSMYSTRTR